MATVPVMDSWTAGEYPSATKMTNNIKNAGDFFREQPACKMVPSAADTATNAVWKTVTLDGVGVDNDSMAVPASSRIVIQTTGVYVIAASLVWAFNASGRRLMAVTASAAGAGTNYMQVEAAPSTNATSLTGTTIAYLTAGSTLYLSGYQSSGGNLATISGSQQTWLAAWWISV